MTHGTCCAAYGNTHAHVHLHSPSHSHSHKVREANLNPSVKHFNIVKFFKYDSRHLCLCAYSVGIPWDYDALLVLLLCLILDESAASPTVQQPMDHCVCSGNGLRSVFCYLRCNSHISETITIITMISS